MNSTQDIMQEVERHAQSMRSLVDALKAHILSLPDNPRIKRERGNPHCFTMSFSSLSAKAMNLSGEHHDFKKQYELIVAELDRCQPDGIMKRLLTIIGEGKVQVGSNRSYVVTLHADVLKHLKKVAGVSRVRWLSKAEWPKGTCPGDASDDTHDTRSQAQAICEMLSKQGFGGDRKIFPSRTWTEPVGIPEEAV